MESALKQDLPPPGGYRPINFKRIPAKTYFSGYQLFFGWTVMTIGSMYLYGKNYKKVKQEEVEKRGAYFAMLPALTAEKDRAYLKQLRKNREEEARLMANVPNWKVGTYFGEPVYKTLPKDHWVDLSFAEYYVHANSRDKDEAELLQLMS